MATGGVVSSITRMGTIEPFELQVGRGQITMHQPYFRFGWANAVGATPQTITSLTSAGSAYTYPSSATVMKVSSASANDAAAGTGARTFLVAGLDANYNRISEVVTLNGQTQVTTTNSYLRILYTEILSTGSGNAQAGIIYVGTGSATLGVPSTVYWQSETSYNNFGFAGYTVPAGYTAYVTSYTVTSQSTTANQNVSCGLVIYEFGNGSSLTGQGYPEFQSTARLTSSSTFDRHFDYPLAITEKCDFELRAWNLTGTTAANVTGEIQFVLIKNDSQTA
jgi:hypothetical protein